LRRAERRADGPYPSCDSCRRSSAGFQSAPWPKNFSLPPATSQRAPPVRTVLLSVDQQLGEGPLLWVPVELADAVGAVEAGKHQDVDELGAGSGTDTRILRRYQDVVPELKREAASKMGELLGG
jgi:hypothetical protein